MCDDSKRSYYLYASLEGAVYGLYARNDIVHPDGATGAVFKAGDLVATLTTDKNGEAEVNNLYLGSLFARLSFKKKSRADIVKLVASGDLVPAQLVQIKSAIEKGLTESQLVELINNNISAEKMKEIIEIAVLENSMAD